MKMKYFVNMGVDSKEFLMEIIKLNLISMYFFQVTFFNF